jgi:hypothetical protein
MTTSYNFKLAFSDQRAELDAAGVLPLYPKLGQLHPKLWRLMVPWANVTAGGGRDWSFIDNTLADMMLLTGADPILIIGQSMPSGWTNAMYQAFCAEVVTRYQPGGVGIPTTGKYAPLAGRGARYFEIWNEQNNQRFWTAPLSATNYVALLKAGHDGVKSVLPGSPTPGVAPTGNQSVVIFGGMQHTQFTGPWYNPFIGGGYGTTSEDEYTFLQQCYAAATAAGYSLGSIFDALATHVYPWNDLAINGDYFGGVQIPGLLSDGSLIATALITGTGQVNLTTPAQNGVMAGQANISGTGSVTRYRPAGPTPNVKMDSFQQILAMRSLMVQNGDGAKKMMITELGYGMLDVPGITTALQKTWVQACFDILNSAPFVSFIDTVCVYSGVDATNSTTADGSTGYGALDYLGNPRDLYYWLLGLVPTMNGGGALNGSAIITGTGAIGPVAAGVMNAAATIKGAGSVGVSGGIAFANITGTGVVTAGLTARATITGSGVVGEGVPGEVGVVGVIGQGALNASAAIAGAGAVTGIPAGGAMAASAAITGTGVVGVVGSGAMTALATWANTELLALFGSGSINVQAAIGGSGPNVLGGQGTINGLAAINGAGVVGDVAVGSPTVLATIHGAGLVGAKTGGALNASASITGTGTMAATDGGSLNATATITGTGVVGKVGGGVMTATATVSGNLVSSAMKAFWIGTAPAMGGTGQSTNGVCNMDNPWIGTADLASGTDPRIPLSDDITITKLTVWVTTAPGAGSSWIFSVRSGTTSACSNTSASVTISGTNTTATWTGTVALTQLTLIDMGATGTGSPVSPGRVFWTIEYKTAGNWYLLPATNMGNPNNSNTTEYDPPNGGTNTTPSTTDATAMEVLVPTACTVTKIAAYSPFGNGGGGSTNTFSVRKNNTTDSSFSASFNTNDAVSSAGTLAFAQGDTMVVKQVKGPSSAWSYQSTCMTIVPNNAGEIIVPFGNLNAPSTSAVNYEAPQGHGLGWNATESAVQMKFNACTLKDLASKLVTAPGTGKSRALTVRKNAADTTLTCTTSDTNTTASDTTHTVSVSDGDLISVSETPSGTPAASNGLKLGLVCVPV